MPKKNKVIYRRPKVYIPPYNYCDRACGACAIDKSRCLLYQTEMDERLHREIDGLGEPTAEEVAGRIVDDCHRALKLVEEQAEKMGLDLDAVRRAAPPAPPRKMAADGAVKEASEIAARGAEFLRAHGAAHPQEALKVRHFMTLAGPKLGRATAGAADDIERADNILSAQVAHRALAAMDGALEAMRRREPSLGDAMVDLRSAIGSLKTAIEARWLRSECDLLEPAFGADWWGPLRDVTPTLKHFRR